MSADETHGPANVDEDGNAAPDTSRQEQVAEPPILAGLTTKDREVLDLLVAHNSNKEIGLKLKLSESAVEARLRALKLKLGTNSRNDTARLYERLIGTKGKTFEGFPGMSDGAWPDLGQRREGPLPDPLLLHDASPFSGDAARRARGGLWPNLGAIPERLPLPVVLLIVALISALLGFAFLAVVAMIRDLANNGLPGFLT